MKTSAETIQQAYLRACDFAEALGLCVPVALPEELPVHDYPRYGTVHLMKSANGNLMLHVPITPVQDVSHIIMMRQEVCCAYSS